MKKAAVVLGYAWAVLCTGVALATFMGNAYFGRALAIATGVTVSPWFSGGEVRRVIDHEGYRTLIHRPVFDGLVGDRASGFIQVNWQGATDMPQQIKEEVDYNDDGQPDFIIRVDTLTGKADLVAYNRKVTGITRTSRLSDGWAVRIAVNR